MLNGRVQSRARTSRPPTTRRGLTPGQRRARHLPRAGGRRVRDPPDHQRPPAAGLDADAVRAWIDGTRVGDQELDPSLGAGFEPGEQELSGRRVEFRLKLKAGEHWIAGTPLRLFEGLPASFGGPAPSTLPPPPKPEFKPRPGMTPEQIEFAKKRFEARLTERMVVNTPRVGGIEIIGPYGSDGRPSAESQARIFTCRHRRSRTSPRAALPDRRRGWRGGPTAGR